MTTKLRFSFLGWLVALVALLAVGCGSDAAGGQLSFEVDPGVKPGTDSIEFVDGSGERPLASITDDKGRQIDFVEDEVVLTLEDRSELPSILERLNGTVLREIDPVANGAPDGTPLFVLVRVDPREADPSELVEMILSSEGDNRAAHRVSSQAALDALTAMARESVEEGTELGANFLFEYDSLSEREALEAPTGGTSDYTQDAFDWPYMNRGSNQDIGAAEAARMVHDAGRVPTPSNKVDFMIMDGGFLDLADFPRATIIGGRFGTPNPNACSGGNPCPWHGTMVASTAISVFDNGQGAAGPASEVVNPIFVQSPNPNLWDYLEYIFVTVPTALSRFPDIVNISASGGIPAGLCLVGVCTAVDIAASSIHRAGILVFASAGNDGADVDDEDWFWESEYRVPCEAPGVVCVGGLAHNATVKDPSSARGSKQRDSGNSVDIYAPFWTWVHQTPTGATPTLPGTNATFVSGTSFSSPFVAAVAALVKASDPSLGPDGIWTVIRDTAHTTVRGSVHRWVNAFGAVHRALGDNAPPFVQIARPTDGETFPLRAASVPLSCDVSDEDGMDGVTVSWSSDRDGRIGGESMFTSSGTLSEGFHQITCTADDGEFVLSDTVTIEVVNEAPRVTIEQPIARTRYYASEPIALAASAVDRNFNLDGVSWDVDGFTYLMLPFEEPRPVPFTFWSGNGISQTIPGGVLPPGTYDLVATATDTSGASASDTIEIIVEADPLDRRPSISHATITATSPNLFDTPPSTFWQDQCAVDVTGDGAINNADRCKQLVFSAVVSDDHDAASALTYEWDIIEIGVVADTLTSSGPNLTLDLVYGNYQVTLTVTDSAGQASVPYTWTFAVTTLI